ncbi:hypothetical protein ACFVTE_03365 [Arthrobacter sp. NPDC058097]|uniref:hypothetical protein n=1 Tax=Arthrobacter sp. NPDC058097 TaxID=3346340 RepID=UPI0036DF9930
MNQLQESTLGPINEWHTALGTAVEIRHAGVTQHRGFVDDVMVDGSGLWLAAYGVSLRVFVAREEGTELWPAHQHRDE